MQSIWDSIEFLDRFNAWAKVLIAVFAILTATLGVFSLIASKRISTLQKNAHTLSESQVRQLKDKLSTKLSSFSHTIPIMIVTQTHQYQLTVNSELFAKQILSILQDLGWQASLSQAKKCPLNGVSIQTFSKDIPSGNDFLQSMTSAFVECDILTTTSLQVDPKYDETFVRVFIGLTPIN